MTYSYTLNQAQTLRGVGWRFIIWSGQKGQRKVEHLSTWVYETRAKAQYRARKYLKDYCAA